MFVSEAFCAKNRKKLRNLFKIWRDILDMLPLSVYNGCRTLQKGIQGVCIMKISYKKLWILLIERDISPATLRTDLNIATGTMTKLRKNEEVALSVLLRICEYLDCNIGDVCDAVRAD